MSALNIPLRPDDVSNRLRDLCWIGCVALAYFAAASLGLWLTFENGTASVLWAPSGIALAAFLLRGPRIWPGILLGCLATETINFGWHVTAIEVPIVNTGAALLGASALTFLCGRPFDFTRVRNALAFVVIGAAIPAVLTSCNAMAMLLLTTAATTDVIRATWLAWWAGDVAGAIIVAPVVLAWFAGPALTNPGRKCIELAVAIIALVATTAVVFASGVRAIYVIVPLIAWIVLRFSLRESATAVLLITVIGAEAAITKHQPSVMDTLDGRLIELALFMTATAALVLLASAWLSTIRTAEKNRIRTSEERLRESEARFRNAFDYAQVGMAIVSLQGQWTRVNSALCRIVGYSEVELLARDFQSITHPDDLAQDLDYLRALLANEVSMYRMEKRYIHKDGSTLWILLTVSAVRDDGGKVMYFVSHIQDITLRKTDELAREEVIEQLRKLEEIGSVGGWYLDCATYRQTLTPGMCAILEIVSAEDAASHANLNPFWTRPEATKDPELRAAVRAALTNGAPLDLTIKTVTAKDRQVWLHLRAEAIWKNEKIVGLSGYAQDITLQHQFKEKALASQKMEAIGQLTAGIAHDFNNLLAAISLNIELIADDPGTSSFQTQRAKVAKKACDRGAKLTRQLLAFARKQALATRRQDLRALVGNAATLLTHTLPTNIAIEVTTAPDLSAWVEIDEAQFDNAILNLGLNARDAMPNGGSLRISIAPRDVGLADLNKTLPPGRYVAVSVEDTGVGMSAAARARAFDPFFTTKSFGEGSGLGLSMVQGFVCQSGGDTEIRSSIGEGTTVEMLFPLLENGSQEMVMAAEPSATFAGNAMRVLLVEDMDDVREACQIQLEGLGFRVDALHNGAAACGRIAEDDDFDLLITDLDMPGGVNGNHLADVAARAIPGLKIITMTGYNEGHLKIGSEIRTSDNRVHLQKPFSRADLADALHRLLGRQAEAEGQRRTYRSIPMRQAS